MHDAHVVGHLEKTVINCPAPRDLAEFYCAVLGMAVQQDYEDWVTIGSAPGMRELAFQRSPGWQRPKWPDPTYLEQMHLDIRVLDPDEAGSKVLALGALRASPSAPETGFRVFIDPAGHPFCLVFGPGGHADPRWRTLYDNPPA